MTDYAYVARLAFEICARLGHPLIDRLPELRACPTSREVAFTLLDHPDVVDRWRLAESA